LLTAVVILLSKYFSRANEKRNSEKTEIKIEGIKVNSEKKVIYLKLVVFFLVSILIFNEFLISINISIKKNSNNIMFKIKRSCRLKSVSFIKLLSIKVKKVKNPIDKVNIKITIINAFFLINFAI
tara:strand:- start:649 stop:1023 length:375 start_codon:yes stop_codon:yes gene_type:complete